MFAGTAKETASMERSSRESAGGSGMASTEGRGIGADTIDEVFLTPRIVDQRTFEEYSLALRELIESASAQGSTLESAALTAQDTTAGVEKIAAALNGRLKSAEQVLPALDERLGRIEKLLESAVDAAKVSERVASEVDGQLNATLDERLGTVEQRVAEVAVRLERRLDGIESRASKATEQAERTVVGQADRLEALIDKAEGGAAQLDERTTSAIKQIDDRLGGVGEAIDQRVSQIKRELAAMTGPAVTSLNLLCQRAQELIGRDPRLGEQAEDAPPFTEGSLGAMLERAAGVTRDATAQDAKLTELRGLAEQAKAELFEAVQSAAERAAALEARQEPIDQRLAQAGEACKAIEAFLDQHEAMLERTAKLPTGDDLKDAERRAKAFEKVLKQIDAAQQTLDGLGETAKAERKSLDLLGGRARRLAKGVQETEAKLSSVESLAAEQLAKIEGTLDEPVAALDKQVREAGAWLTQMIERAQGAQQSMAEAHEQVGDVEQRVSGIVARLEPWRNVLARTPSDGLPAGVSEMIGEVRTRIGDELDRAEAVLASLRAAAESAEAGAGSARAGSTKAGGSSAGTGTKKARAKAKKLERPTPPPPSLDPIRFRRADRVDQADQADEGGKGTQAD